MPQIRGDELKNIKQTDLRLVGDLEIEEKGLVNAHLSSMNEFYETGISQIITQGYSINSYIINDRDITEEDREIEKIQIQVTFTKVEMDKPTMINYKTGREIPLFPNLAIMSNKTYASNLYIYASITATAYNKNGTTSVREAKLNKFKLCRMPVMVGSNICNTHGFSEVARQAVREDPEDEGGYFIVKGVEWSIDCIENNLFNQIRLFENVGHGKEIFRSEFVSKPGDAYQNQGYFIVKVLTNGQITCTISKANLRLIEIPFYLLFRLMGMSNDREIFDNIVYDYDTPEGGQMVDFLNQAFSVKYKGVSGGKNVYLQNDILKLLVDEIKQEFKYLELGKNPGNYKQVFNKLQNELNDNFFPHIGRDVSVRKTKARFLGLMIRKIFLLRLNLISPTDRDSFISKRIHPAGPSYAKPFKSYFNAVVLQKARVRYYKDFKDNPFTQVDLLSGFKNGVYGTDLERLLAQSITSGTKTQLTVNSQRRIQNRLSSQLLVRKNKLNTLATAREVTTTTSESAKSTTSAKEMRGVHTTAHGFLCNVHSPEGGNVGVNKQLAIYATVTLASSSYALKDTIIADTLFIKMSLVIPIDIEKRKLSAVYVNGDLIGYTENSIRFVSKYKKLRRALTINPYTTIHWDVVQDEVYFWVDSGRLIRPMFIVYNTIDNPEMFDKKTIKSGKFTQSIAITEKNIESLLKKDITMHELMETGVIEYVSAEEQTNVLLCYELDRLKQDKHNPLIRYTHCDTPQAQSGITALTSPFASHNQATRLVYQTNQAKQTCGYFALNWAYRCDKAAFLQYRNESALARTIVNRYVTANGSNCIVGIACQGFNQEDSLVCNRAAIHRGLFDGSKFTYLITKLEQRENFGVPDINTTQDIKSANYSKLDSRGFIREGVIITNGDAIVGKFAKLTRVESTKYLYSDQSLIYKDMEDAIVHKVYAGKDENDEDFCKIVIRIVRPVESGDKFSSRAGQKGICGILMRESDLMRTREGMSPAIIINPHCIPTRMTIGQLIESSVSKLCAITGEYADATCFTKYDLDKHSKRLVELGYHPNGYSQVYDGVSGEIIDVLIFLGPIFYQRLMRFMAETIHVVDKGPTNALTYQPPRGRTTGGGLKIGVMEVWSMTAHGVSRFQMEKFRDDSDGYIQYKCRCGSPGIVNEQLSLVECISCGDSADIANVETSWCSKLVFQELKSIGVGVKQYLKPITYQNKSGRKPTEK